MRTAFTNQLTEQDSADLATFIAAVALGRRWQRTFRYQGSDKIETEVFEQRIDLLIDNLVYVGNSVTLEIKLVDEPWHWPPETRDTLCWVRTPKVWGEDLRPEDYHDWEKRRLIRHGGRVVAQCVVIDPINPEQEPPYNWEPRKT